MEFFQANFFFKVHYFEKQSYEVDFYLQLYWPDNEVGSVLSLCMFYKEFFLLSRTRFVLMFISTYTELVFLPPFTLK